MLEASEYDTVRWCEAAIKGGFGYLLIVKDLEDKDIFPVYFQTEAAADRYSNNIVSESKLKVLRKINISELKA